MVSFQRPGIMERAVILYVHFYPLGWTISWSLSRSLWRQLVYLMSTKYRRCHHIARMVTSPSLLTFLEARSSIKMLWLNRWDLEKSAVQHLTWPTHIPYPRVTRCGMCQMYSSLPISVRWDRHISRGLLTSWAWILKEWRMVYLWSIKPTSQRGTKRPLEVWITSQKKKLSWLNSSGIVYEIGKTYVLACFRSILILCQVAAFIKVPSLCLYSASSSGRKKNAIEYRSLWFPSLIWITRCIADSNLPSEMNFKESPTFTTARVGEGLTYFHIPSSGSRTCKPHCAASKNVKVPMSLC